MSEDSIVKKERTPPNKGRHWSEEYKRKMSLALKGRPCPNKGKHFSIETRHKVSHALAGNQHAKGHHHSEEQKKNISVGLLKCGTVGIYERTPEIRYKLRIAHLGKKASSETKAKMSLQRKGRKLAVGQCVGPKNPMYGKQHSEESKRKMSLKLKGKGIGRKQSEETKEKIRLAHLGKKFSQEHCQNLSRARTGRKLSEENKRKLSFTHKGNLKVLKHLSTIWMKIPKITKPQRELYQFLKQIFSDATLEYSIKTNRTYRYADIGIPSRKIDFEYDEYCQHGRHTPEENKKRDIELAEVGWSTFRINKEVLKTLSKQKISEIMENR